MERLLKDMVGEQKERNNARQTEKSTERNKDGNQERNMGEGNKAVGSVTGRSRANSVTNKSPKVSPKVSQKRKHMDNSDAIPFPVSLSSSLPPSISSSIPQFDVVDFSGTTVHAGSFYQVIAARLGIPVMNTAKGETIARNAVLARFRSDPREGRNMTVLMIDEIDKAPRRAIKELFEIMSVATSSSSSSSSSFSSYSSSSSSTPTPSFCSVVIVGIANDLRFKDSIGVSYAAQERVTVVCFKPYDVTQLQSIITSRSLGVMDARATHLIAARGLRSDRGKHILM